MGFRGQGWPFRSATSARRSWGEGRGGKDIEKLGSMIGAYPFEEVCGLQSVRPAAGAIVQSGDFFDARAAYRLVARMSGRSPAFSRS